MSRSGKANLYWNTVRHLRPVQVRERIRRRLIRPAPDLSAPPPRRVPVQDAWVRPAERLPSLAGPRHFSFMNEAHDVGPSDWDGARFGKLWSYNLNYFDDLNARGSNGRREWHAALLREWVWSTSPGRGTPWEPYPTSLRIVNWIKWSLGGNELPVECVESLAFQARWVGKRLETHLLGNHLFANAKALVFAGLFFDGAEPAGWLEKGFSLLAREICEQVLPDGGQFELSPMYHALALEDLLDLLNVSRAYPVAVKGHEHILAEWWRRVDDMRLWLAAMCHPDGEIAFFNDAAMAIAPAPAEVDSYAERLGLGPSPRPAAGLHHLAELGYIRLTHGPMTALLDVARVGPDYLPGHAHADTLSFELSIGAQRVLVNSGTSCYGTSTERLRQRGTAAHNTVVVDGEDLSEVWSGFRVARRAYPFDLNISEDGPWTIACAHDGYRRLKGRPVHRRVWTSFEGELQVVDILSGSAREAVAHFHFHPDLRLVPSDGCGSGGIRLPDGRLVHWDVTAGGPASIEPVTWHPRFGESRQNLRLAVSLVEGRSAVTFRWDA